MKISSTNFVTKGISKGLDNFAKWKPMSNFYENAYKHKAKYAARLLVISLVSKDAINWVFYVTQSLHNKEIPEEKRTLVTSLDIMNGFFNIGGQIASFALIERLLTPKLESLYTGIHKNPKTDEETYVNSKAPLTRDSICKALKDSIHESPDEIKKLSKGLTPKELLKHENFEPLLETVMKKSGGIKSPRGEAITTALGIIVSTLATTALIKRTITPLCATPLATWWNNFYFVPRREARKKAEAEKEPKLDIIESEIIYQNNKFGEDGKRPIFKTLNSK